MEFLKIYVIMESKFFLAHYKTALYQYYLIQKHILNNEFPSLQGTLLF